MIFKNSKFSSQTFSFLIVYKQSLSVLKLLKTFYFHVRIFCSHDKLVNCFDVAVNQYIPAIYKNLMHLFSFDVAAYLFSPRQLLKNVHHDCLHFSRALHFRGKSTHIYTLNLVTEDTIVVAILKLAVRYILYSIFVYSRLLSLTYKIPFHQNIFIRNGNDFYLMRIEQFRLFLEVIALINVFCNDNLHFHSGICCF